MNTHYIKTISGGITYIDETMVEKLRAEVSKGKDIWYKGKLLPHHQITDFDFIKKPALPVIAIDVFTPSKDNFWRTVALENRSRHADKKMYVFAYALYIYARELKLSKDEIKESVKDILDAIAEMPQSWLDDHNKAFKLGSGIW